MKPRLLDLFCGAGGSAMGYHRAGFFVVGVDIKKEFVYGSLASIRKAVLPCLGALGGMVVPMVVYTLCNLGLRAGASVSGWAVPMATDIAFAMGVFNFFKSRMPGGAQAFLLTLATVDDLGAIAVIAVLYAPHELYLRLRRTSDALSVPSPQLRWLDCGALLDGCACRVRRALRAVAPRA